MGSTSSVGHRSHFERLRGRGRWRQGEGKRAVAEVVATIILLALTVVLFSAIFAFVTTFPSPPAQSNNQFQATLSYTVAKNGTTYITGVSILHLSGPAVPQSTIVYLKSAAHPSAAQFQNPYNLTAGGIAKGATWNLGQTWSISLPSGTASLPDNLTVYVVSSSAVLFSVVLPGQSFLSPPTFLATAVSPASPTIGESFNITATIAGSVKSYSVYANLGGVPGFTNSYLHLKYAAASGEYYYVAGALSTTAGTYYGFINATGPAPYNLTATTAVAITISSGTPVVTTPTLSLSPDQGPFVNTITATGAGFSASTSVALTLNGATITLTACSSGTIGSPATSVTTTASGGFVCTFSLPSGIASGTYTVFASGLSSGQTATALFLVTTPTVTAPTSGSTLIEGKTQAVTGTGFSVSSTVKITLAYTSGASGNPAENVTETCTTGSLSTTATGTFSCTVTLPASVKNASSGTFSIEDLSTGRWFTVSVTMDT